MKHNLRKVLRAKRRALRARDYRLWSSLAASAIARLAAFKSGARIAMYLPVRGETDTAALIASARRRGIRIFVPVVTDLRHRRVRFHPLTGKTRPGTYGIRVPENFSRRRGEAVGPRWFNLVVVPLVGIDHKGHRLGMGGGFYDRAFAFRRLRRRWRGPHLVGLAFECQKVESISRDLWDLKLDAVATESGIEYFGRDFR